MDKNHKIKRLQKLMSQDLNTHLKWVQKSLGELQDPIDLTNLYKRVDTLLNKIDAPSLSNCKKKCSSCCMGSTPMTYAEALNIQNKGISKIRVSQASAGLDSCHFLDPSTKKCTIYRHRPLSCRSRFQLDDITNCTPKGGQFTIDEKSAPAVPQVIQLLSNHIKDPNGVGIAQINQWFKN